MTPHRRRVGGKPVGSLLLEWERQPVGRIYRATGLEDSPSSRKRLRQIHAACDTLLQAGRLDVLDAVRRGLVHPLRVLEALRLDRLHLLATAEYVAGLDALMRPWAARTVNPSSRANRRAVLGKLLAARPAASVGELPDLVKTVMGELAATPATANRIREQAMAFVRDTLGRDHRLHAAIAALETLETRPVRKRTHLTPPEFRAVLGQLGPAAEAFRLLCLTGMNPKEAWEDGFELDGAGVRIHGQKAKDRERIVPRLADDLVPPDVSRDVLIWHLRKVGLTPYDARRSYSRWVEDAGIPPWRVRAYLGHSAGNQSEVYQRGDMTRYLVGDGALLRAHLGLPGASVALAVTA